MDISILPCHCLLLQELAGNQTKVVENIRLCQRIDSSEFIFCQLIDYEEHRSDRIKSIRSQTRSYTRSGINEVLHKCYCLPRIHTHRHIYGSNIVIKILYVLALFFFSLSLSLCSAFCYRQ